MAGKLEAQKQLEELQQRVVELETANADLQSKLVNVDRERAGATADEIAEWEGKIKAEKAEAERLQAALLASDQERSELRAKVNELLQADSMQSALEGHSFIDMQPIPSMTGFTEPLPGVESMKMATFAMDMDGGGVVMVTVVNDQPVVSVLDKVKLANTATGTALKRRPEYR
jgi:predicted RNase H-like nuclease (RuvC/YqgF family)